MVNLREVKNMFWGVTLDGGKRYTQTVERSFHISMAALQSSDQQSRSEKSGRHVMVMIQHDKAEFVLCTLDPVKVRQQPLDLYFTEGEEVTFFLNGNGLVHLTGYLMEDQYDEDTDQEFDMQDMSDESSSEESDSREVPDLVSLESIKDLQKDKKVSKKRKGDEREVKAKKSKVMVMEEELDSSDEEDEDWTNDAEKDNKQDDDDDEEEDDESDSNFLDDMVGEGDEDSEDEDSDMSENEPDTPLLSVKKKNKAQTKEKTKQQTEQKTPVKKEDKAADQNSTEQSEGKKKKKKKKKKKNKDSEENSATDTKQPTETKQTPKKKVLAGGTLMEEQKLGHGPEAKPGKMVSVYYSGKLSNGKQFDACNSGKPFRFRLGKKEVIQGWDTGLAGMKVGGKRRLTVPPSQGYGSQKEGPIPANSTLVFEIELKAVS